MLKFPFSWITFFILTCYMMGVACLYRGFLVGSSKGWKRGWREIGIFLLFCGLGFGVESWAHARTPYYYYSPDFPDRLPRLPVEYLPWFIEPPVHPCSTAVRLQAQKLDHREIPLAIPIMEGSLAFAALWTSRFLGAPVWLRPFLAGLVLVNVDALIDPVVASTHACGGAVLREGLGFWHWYIDDTYIAHWYGIPLFNFAGWYGAAVLLVSLAHLIGWGGHASRWLAPKIIRRMQPIDPPPFRMGALWLALVFGPALVLSVSPSWDPPPGLAFQWVVVVGVVGGTGFLVWLCGRQFDTHRHERQDLTRTLILPVLFGVFALLADGQFMDSPSFLVVALVTACLGALLCWWPYEEAVRRFGQRLAEIDLFIRLHYLGYPWMLVLLGAAFAAHSSLSAGKIGGVLVVALCFHIYSCVLNDVIDLEIDRTQVRRQYDPLVRGRIDRTTAHVFALIQLPIIALVTQLFGGGVRLEAIAVACGLMGAYNRWGKLFPIPPVTDTLQGIAWGMLALYGALIAGEIGFVPWIVFAYGAAFMSLINGIHGGLRDLSNDLHWHRKNTALLLGAKPSPDDPFTVFSTKRVAVFAFTLHTLMLALMGWALYRNDLAYHMPITHTVLTPDLVSYRFVRGGVIAVFVLVAIWCHILLWRLVKPGWAQRDAAGSMHAFAILLLPLIVFTPALDPVMQFVVPLCYFVPLLAQFLDPIVGSVFPKLRGQLHGAPQTRIAPTVGPSLP